MPRRDPGRIGIDKRAAAKALILDQNAAVFDAVGTPDHEGQRNARNGDASTSRRSAVKATVSPVL